MEEKGINGRVRDWWKRKGLMEEKGIKSKRKGLIKEKGINGRERDWWKRKGLMEAKGFNGREKAKKKRLG